MKRFHKLLITRSNLALLLIVIIGGLLRFLFLTSTPVSLYWDETAIAYNAYSIAQTGKDEYGTSFPLLFRSYDDYKMPGSIYLTALVVFLFGLNEFTTRFVSAFLGTLSILATFLLVRELFSTIPWKKGSDKNTFRNNITKLDNTGVGLLSALILAFSPWHLQFSRANFEANSGLFFIVVGTWLFLKGTKNSYSNLIGSVIMYALSFYFYRSIHIFLPFFVLGLCLTYRKELRYFGLRKLLVACLLGLLLVLPLVPAMLSDGGMVRARQVNFSQNIDKQLYEAALKQQEDNTFINRLFYNRRVVYLKEFYANYVSYYSFEFLFAKGDGNNRHSIAGMGLLYLWEIPFLIIGLISLIFLPWKIKSVIVLWLLLAPIPASLSVPSPHALRSLNILPMIQILSALGIIVLYLFLKKPARYIFLVLLLLCSSYFFIRYLDLYYNHAAKIASKDWADGYKQLTNYIFENEDKYGRIIVTGQYWQPYMYFLFYKQYDPTLYQQFGSAVAFDKYYFGGTSWDRDRGRVGLEANNLFEIADNKKTLVALSPDEYQKHKQVITKINEIKNHNNELVFILGELQ